MSAQIIHFPATRVVRTPVMLAQAQAILAAPVPPRPTLRNLALRLIAGRALPQHQGRIIPIPRAVFQAHRLPILSTQTDLTGGDAA